MHMLWRTLLHILFLSRRRDPVGHYDLVRTRFITLPTDVDVNLHINNGVYFSIMDVARFDAIVRSGGMAIARKLGWYPVVVQETISFRKSIALWQRFTIETQVLGLDEKSVFFEQRFVAPGPDGVPEIYAQAFVRTRFLKKAGGSVSSAELVEALGVAPQHVPDWLSDWAASTQLPPRHVATPSVWED